MLASQTLIIKKTKPDQTEQFVGETYLGHCQTSLGKVFGEQIATKSRCGSRVVKMSYLF